MEYVIGFVAFLALACFSAVAPYALFLIVDYRHRRRKNRSHRR